MAGVLDTAATIVCRGGTRRAGDGCAGDGVGWSRRYHGAVGSPNDVAGKPITDRLSSERLAALIKRTQDGGAEIVGLLKTGSAFYAPSAAVVDMVEAIAKDQKRVVPCAMLVRREYGLKDVIVGVPVRLGRGVGNPLWNTI